MTYKHLFDLNSAVEVCGRTWARVDDERVQALALRASRVLLPAFEDPQLIVHVFRPPVEDGQQAPLGYLELWLSACESVDEGEAMLSIEFGGPQAGLEYDLDDWTLEDARESAETQDSYAFTVGFNNFDEAFYFACQLGERLGVTAVGLRFGA